MNKFSYALLTFAVASSAFFVSCINVEKSSKPLDLPGLQIPEDTQKKWEEQLRALQNQITNIYGKYSQRTQAETVNLKEKVPFHIVYTNAGFLYLASESIEKHHDGYRLKMKIGNPLAVDFSDLRIKLNWDGATAKNNGANKEKGFVINELPSSSWKMFEVVLSPMASDKDLENLHFEVKVNQVRLLKS